MLKCRHVTLAIGCKHGQVDQKGLRYHKKPQIPKGRTKTLFNLDFCHGDLYCCANYPNVEYQDEILKTYP